MDIDAILSQYKEANSQYGKLKSDIDELNHQIEQASGWSKRGTRRELTANKERLESQMEASDENLRKVLSQYHAQLIIVPGDEARFEQMAGYPVEVVDLGLPNKGVVIAQRRGRRDYNGFQGSDYQTSAQLMLEHRVVGMINAQLTQSDWSSRWDRGTERLYFGLPVQKKAE